MNILLHLLLFSLMFPVTFLKKLYVEQNVPKSKCILNTLDFISVYSIYFKDVTLITVVIIDFENSMRNVASFADEVGKMIIYYDKQKTIKWKRINFKKVWSLNNNYTLIVDPEQRISINSVKWFANMTGEKIKKHSRNKASGYILIAWNERHLHLAIQKNSKRVIPDSRAIYFVCFVKNFSSSQKYSIKSLLPTFWRKYNVFNAMAIVLCSKKSRIFIFDPFYYENNTWGIVKKFKLTTIAEDPNKPFEFMNNFNGYPLKVSLFERKPTVLSEIPRALRDSRIYSYLKSYGGYGGVDGCVLASLASSLNFSIKIKKISNGQYGSVYHKKATGSLGDVVYKRVDISANGRFMVPYGIDDFEFTTPVSNDILCPVVPKSERISKWKMLFHGFYLETWMTILGIVFLCIVAWYFFKCKNSRRINEFQIAFFEIYGLLLNVPIRLPLKLSQRIFIASFLAFNVIITSIFQGTLVQSFTTVSYYADINTLIQLEKSNLHIATSLPVFKNDQSETMKKLHKRVIDLNVSSLEQAAFSRNVAAMERKQDADFIIHTKFTKNGTPLLHVMSECPYSYFIAYIVPKGSPFLPKFNKVILDFFESGLLTKWYKDFVDAIILESLFTKQDNHPKPFALEDIQTAFYLLILGYIIAILIFLGEIVVRKYELKRTYVEFIP